MFKNKTITTIVKVASFAALVLNYKAFDLLFTQGDVSLQAAAVSVGLTTATAVYFIFFKEEK